MHFKNDDDDNDHNNNDNKIIIITVLKETLECCLRQRLRTHLKNVGQVMLALRGGITQESHWCIFNEERCRTFWS